MDKADDESLDLMQVFFEWNQDFEYFRNSRKIKKTLSLMHKRSAETLIEGSNKFLRVPKTLDRNSKPNKKILKSLEAL